MADQSQHASRESSSGETSYRILVADDAPVSRAILDRLLSPDYTVLQAADGEQALKILRGGGVNMVLSDILMPKMSGLELLRAMRADETLASVPVIMITADGNAENEIEALRLGAVDVVRKPFAAHILRVRVRNLLALQAAARAAEQSRRDRLQMKLQAEELRTMERDELTGVLNRQAFYRHVRAYLDAHPGQQLEMIRFDLDNFSTVNDLMGVKAGDRLLAKIGHEILSYGDFTTETPVAGHIEADHFAALHNPAKQPAEELFSRVQGWLAKNAADSCPNCRFGVYPITDPTLDPAVMCDRALLALRSTKGNFTQRFARYDDSLRQKLLEEQQLTDEMLPALLSGQFVIYYQPQVNYSSGELIGAEALIRWNHPKKGMLPPSVFLPLFERNGLVTQLDNFVWESVCRQLTLWRNRFGGRVAPVSVNISRVDTYDEDLCARLTELVRKYGLPQELLRLEITESAYVGDAKRLGGIVKQLSQAGFTVEMDDFGSAYSSLNMLKDIPVDILKLDMKFLSDTENSIRSGNILSSVVRMARWLQLPVIAEGVETKQQADYLCSIGCLYMQGYYFSKPISPEEYENFLQCRALGKTDKYCHTDISTAERFWDASTQTALIFNSYVGGAVILQRTGDELEMLRANDEFFKTLHTTREDYLPAMLHVWRRFSPDGRKTYNAMLDKAARGEEARCDLRSLPVSDGHRDWTRNRAKLLAKNGASEIFYVLVENITAEKAAQEELSRQKSLLSRLYNGVPCGIVDYLAEDGKLRIANFNDTAWKMSGFRNRQEFERNYGKSRGCSMVHPDDLPMLLKKVREAAETGAYTILECRMARAGGTYFPTEIRLHYRTDPAGGDTLQGVFMDISDRREQEVQKYGKLLLTIFDEVFLLDYQADRCRILKGVEPYASSGETVDGLDEMNRSWITRYVQEEDREKTAEFLTADSLRRACACQTIPWVDYRIILPDGKMRQIRSSAVSVDEHRFLLCCRDVTEEKQAARQAEEIAVLQATLEEQERYRIIVEQTGASVVEWNHKTGEFFHSGGYENYAISRCDPRTILRNEGQTTMVHPDDADTLNRFFRESRSGKGGAQATLRLRMTDGSYRWTRIHGNSLRTADGKPSRTIGTLADLDDEMRAKEKLQETSAQLENIISNIPSGIGIYRLDSPRRIIPLYISDHACQIFGFTREECDRRIAAGSPMEFLADVQPLSKERLAAMKLGRPLHLSRVRARRADGSRFWLRLTASLVTDSRGATLCYATMLDVSNLVEAEQSADSLKELYRLLMESTETITFDYSAGKDLLRLSFMNQKNIRTERQYPDYVHFAESGRSRVDPSSRPALLRALHAALEREVHGELDLRALGPDGRRHWYHTKFLSLAQDGAVYRIIGRVDNFDGVVLAQEAKLEEAQIDRVTGLRNKDSGRAAVEKLMARRPRAQRDAMIFLDIDNFKGINDTFGHLDADRILTKLGAILKGNFRATDVAARFGGDEFLVYMVAPESLQVVLDKAARVLEAVRTIPAGGAKFLECSIGVAEVSGALRKFETAFHHADEAMYQSKRSGKHRCSVYHRGKCGGTEKK
ncbi:MAG: EAL domain-containing protein [Oscillibacter sp.]|nr:EAL domain-containing protein [Oscillibacter sp.]